MKKTRKSAPKKSAKTAQPAKPVRTKTAPVLHAHKFAELLPKMTEPEYETLRDDIAVIGQTDDIVLYEGKILDGRHRYRVCIELGIEPIVRDFNGSDAEALQFVHSKSLGREMTESQKAAAAVRMLPEFEKQGISRRIAGVEEPVPQKCQKLVSGKTRAQMGAILKQNGNGRGLELQRKFDLHCGKWPDSASLPEWEKIKQILDAMFGPEARAPQSRDMAAGLFGVSGRYVQDAKLVFERDRKLFDRVFDGELPLTHAKREIQYRDRTRKMVEKAADAPAIGECEIITSLCLPKMAAMNRKTVRLIFADPPYNIGKDYGKGEKADLLPPEEYLGGIKLMIEESFQILTLDGSLWLMINDEWAGEYAVMLKAAGFTIRAWIKWYETFGINCPNNFNRTSRHLFYCVKRPDFFVFNPAAFNRPSDRQTKYKDPRAAKGGKLWDDVWEIPRLVANSPEVVAGFTSQLPLALVEPILLGCSEPGDLVMDPYTGSGTTAVAAVLNGRKFIGYECDGKRAEMARVRVRAAIAGAKE